MRRLAGRVRPVDGVRSGNPSRESRWSMATGTLWSSETLLRDERSSRKAVSVVSGSPVPTPGHTAPEKLVRPGTCVVKPR